jgi:hypothetical protein
VSGTAAVIERNWFHLDQGWLDLRASEIIEEDLRRACQDIEYAATQLLSQMASQYNTAVVSAAHYQEVWAGLISRTMVWPAPPPTIDVQRELLGIFARSYVFGLDGVEGCANELGKVDGVRDSSRGITAKLVLSLKWVKDIRDSLQHIEERVQGKAYGRRIPSSVLVLGDYSDRGFTVTTAAGAIVTIELSEVVLASVRSEISALVRSFTWHRAGPACPACGGSFRPGVAGPGLLCPGTHVTVEWHCARCGFRQQVGRKR